MLNFCDIEFHELIKGSGWVLDPERGITVILFDRTPDKLDILTKLGSWFAAKFINVRDTIAVIQIKCDQ